MIVMLIVLIKSYVKTYTAELQDKFRSGKYVVWRSLQMYNILMYFKGRIKLYIYITSEDRVKTSERGLMPHIRQLSNRNWQ